MRLRTPAGTQGSLGRPSHTSTDAQGLVHRRAGLLGATCQHGSGRFYSVGSMTPHAPSHTRTLYVEYDPCIMVHG